MKKGIDYPGITVVFYCHDGAGNFIMAKRSVNCRDEHGKWDPGGRAVDQGVSVEDTLRKEILEEYCTDVLDYEFLGYHDVQREHNGRQTHWISLDFKVLVDREQVAIGKPHKCDALEWFTLETMPPDDELHSHMPTFVESYKERL